MRARIDGKTYDTETTREIGRSGGESLHVKIWGECFSAGEGGIKPLSLEEARAWIESRLEGREESDAKRKLPRRVGGAQRIPVNSRMGAEEIARLEALCEERGFENADIMLAGIEALEEGIL